MSGHRLGEGPYGSAYRGIIADLFEAGDLRPIEAGDRSFGLFLGQFDWQQSIRHSWQEPARGFWAWLTDQRVERSHVETIPQVQDIRFTGDQHHLIVASSGAGKFRDVLSNMLLYDGSCETACLIIDPKGEAASTVGPMIDAPGDKDARTLILDPWNVTGVGRTDSLTLLDGIRLDNPHCVKDARVLADAIIIERGTDDGHWVATSKAFLAALLLYLGLDPIEEGHRTLFRLRQIVTTPWKLVEPSDEAKAAGIEKEPDFQMLLAYLSQSDFVGGIVARTAQAMLNRDEKERRNILSTLERDTAFIEDPGLWAAIKTDSFDLNQLVLSNKRIHVIIPFDYTKEMSSWLRLTIAAFYNACLRNQLPQRLPSYLRFRHIVVDEFAGLGKLDFIIKDIAEARGAGIKYHLVIQNFPQIRNLYKEGWESLVSNSFIHAFGVNDNFTAEYLSKLTGQSTVITESKGVSESVTIGTSTTSGSSSSSSSSTTGGSSHSTSSSSTRGTSESTTHSHSETKGISTTFSSTGRPVLMPDEIRRISERQQLLFLRGLPVLLTRRTPFFQTFQRFLPQHALRDVLAHRQIGGRQSLVPFAAGDLRTKGPLSAVNSFLRLPSFVPPLYARNSLAQALLQSPGLIAAAVCLLGLAGYGAYAWTRPVPPSAQDRAAAILQAAPGQLSQGARSGLFISSASAAEDVTAYHPAFLVGALAQLFNGNPSCDPEYVIIKGFSAICRWSGGSLLVDSNTMPTSPIHNPSNSFSENGIPLGKDGKPLSTPTGNSWAQNRVYVRFEELGPRFDQDSGRIIRSLTAATSAVAMQALWVPARVGLGLRSCYVFKSRASLDVSCYQSS